ncbi:hypothetical protein M5K25_015871 [Dendrobium thyrsiflorum]|uniref:Uncharacterized protein n=1 Tax=Dendrobium thyrsiflorum TaxID=117978 RepID=A0ABD0URG0_DENTH
MAVCVVVPIFLEVLCNMTEDLKRQITAFLMAIVVEIGLKPMVLVFEEDDVDRGSSHSNAQNFRGISKNFLSTLLLELMMTMGRKRVVYGLISKGVSRGPCEGCLCCISELPEASRNHICDH